MTDKNMNPDEKGRGILLYIRKDLDYKKIDKPNSFEEMQLYELLLDRCNVVIASIYRSPSSGSENNDKLNSFLNY